MRPYNATLVCEVLGKLVVVVGGGGGDVRGALRTDMATRCHLTSSSVASPVAMSLPNVAPARAMCAMRRMTAGGADWRTCVGGRATCDDDDAAVVVVEPSCNVSLRSMRMSFNCAPPPPAAADPPPLPLVGASSCGWWVVALGRREATNGIGSPGSSTRMLGPLPSALRCTPLSS
jgi:hypothetical protein